MGALPGGMTAYLVTKDSLSNPRFPHFPMLSPGAAVLVSPTGFSVGQDVSSRKPLGAPLLIHRPLFWKLSVSFFFGGCSGRDEHYREFLSSQSCTGGCEALICLLAGVGRCWARTDTPGVPQCREVPGNLP